MHTPTQHIAWTITFTRNEATKWFAQIFLDHNVNTNRKALTHITKNKQNIP